MSCDFSRRFEFWDDGFADMNAESYVGAVLRGKGINRFGLGPRKICTAPPKNNRDITMRCDLRHRLPVRAFLELDCARENSLGPLHLKCVQLEGRRGASLNRHLKREARYVEISACRAIAT
jgi:hypothetical protein